MDLGSQRRASGLSGESLNDVLAAYQARVDSITRELHRFLMKHGKGALTREKGRISAYFSNII